MAEWNRNTAILTGIGAALAAAAGYFVSKRLSRDDDVPFAPALRHGGAHGPVPKIQGLWSVVRRRGVG